MPDIADSRNVEAEGNAFDLRSMVGVLLRRWKLVIVVPVAAVIVTAAVLSFIKPQYKSTVEILAADPKRQTNVAEERRLSSLEVDAAAMASEVAVISSKSVALRAARELGLENDPEFQPKPSIVAEFFERLGLASEPAPSPSGPLGESMALDQAATELQRHTTVERVQFSYVLAVSVTSVDPGKAQRLAAAIANAYIADQRQAHQEGVKRATDWLTGRIEEMRSRVLDTETQIEKLKSQSGLVDIGGTTNTNLTQQQTADLNNQLVIARADVAEKRARYEQAQRVVSGKGDIQAIPEVVASPVIGQLRAQQADVSRREAELATHFGERYPDLVNVRSQMKDINKAIDGEVARILANMRNAYEVAQQREQSVEKSLGTLTDDRGKSQASVKLQELQRVDDADRRLYQTFLSSFNDVSQRATLSEVTARIITPATMANFPSSPRKNLILAFTFALGGFVGVVLAFLVEALDATFKTSAQIEEALGVPVLGAKFEVRGGLFGAPGRRRRNSKEAIAGMIANPISRLSEAIRAVRVGLMRAEDGESVKTILVTSSLPGEGKTTSSVLLAASSATAGQRTLLIDCDLRRRSLTRYFGFEGKPGLAEVLGKQREVGEVIVHDERTGLAVLPAGSGAHSPADLLNSWEMRELIRELRDRYDCIVLDASAVLAVVESAILATMVDRILFIVQWNRTPRASVVEAFRSLGPDARNIAGVMMSRVNHKRMQSYGYGHGYGYNYGRYYGRLDKYYG
ncbi:MAG TPA: polysaccharide biosynthesis tyrosine autokinase [Stellaceae bacterium]|nr:polysaccharide biosynthesis tyrosine autokinase [Stellaceae bacterium]